MYCICPNQECGKYWNNYTKLKRTVKIVLKISHLIVLNYVKKIDW